MTDNEIIRIVKDFMASYPMKDWEGDGQEFFETVDEVDLLLFFEELYGIR